MRKLFLLLIGLSFATTSFSQSNLYNEIFTASFTPSKKSGEWLFKSKSHAFSVTIFADEIVPTESPNYITADNSVIQVMTLPLLKSSLDLTKLSIAQQKETLESYATYELDYFKNEAKINYKKLTKEWITINSKLWLLWTFDFFRLQLI